MMIFSRLTLILALLRRGLILALPVLGMLALMLLGDRGETRGGGSENLPTAAD